MTRPRYQTTALLLAALLVGHATTAAPAPEVAQGTAEMTPDAAALPDRAEQAHHALDRAHVRTTYTIYYSYPDETEFIGTEYAFWLDRPGQRLRIDRPGFTLVCDGQTVYLRSESIPDKHLEVALDDGGLTYDALVRLVPDVNDPVPPALALLLADQPMSWLSAGHAPTAQALKPRADDPLARPRLRLPTQLGDITLWLTPDTLLLEDAVLVADAKQLVGGPLTDARFHYHTTIDAVEGPFDDALFTFDTEGSDPASTMAQLLAPPPAPPAPGTGPTLVGLELPDVELTPLAGGDPINLQDLGDSEHRVVVVEFFATWTRPSLTDLGDLTAYQDWCEEEEHDVRVLTVNVMEKTKAVREWFELLSQQTGVEYDLPVLMDTTGEATMGLGLPTIPRTVILIDGAIEEVYGGVKPGFAEFLRENTPRWLGEEAEDEAESDKPVVE